MQLSDTSGFGRNEPDKCIEMTINKDTKAPGGTTGFSTNPKSIIHWSINATFRAELRKILDEFVNYRKQRFSHKDLNPSRISKDEKDVKAILDILSNIFIEPLSENPLLCISSGLLATDEVASDIRHALSTGYDAMQTFIDERLLENAISDIYQPIKRQKLKTFTSMTNVKKVNVKDRVIAVKAQK